MAENKLKKENAALKKALSDMALKSVGLMGQVKKAERERDSIIDELDQFIHSLRSKIK